MGKTQEKPARAARAAAATPAIERKPVSCTDCALCCTYVAIEIDAPTTVKRATTILWYLYHENISVYANGDDWMVQFETRCKQLQSDRKCGVYHTRPHICREYSELDCEVNSLDEGKTFYTPADVMAHMQVHYRRAYREVMKTYAPPAEPPIGNKKARLPLFEQRFRELRGLGIS